MTIRQLYYTSCQDGTEGIQGFQVNALTPGIDRAQVDAGLQLSLYRPSPASPSLPTAEQLDALPIAVGYRSFGTFAVLFHSRYLGSDFTGRQGNYFAHVLVLDEPDRDLAGVLPVETWHGPQWRWTAADRTELPALPNVARGRLDRWSPGAHLRDGRLPGFGDLLSAVQDGLRRRSGQIVVVSSSDEAVALAIAVVTRSLPRALATAVSFVTFTATPGETEVLVAGTSPDVTIPVSPLGDQTVLQLDGAGPADAVDVRRYARVLQAFWMRSDDEAGEAVALASSIRPPVEAAELDELSHLLELVVPESIEAAAGLDVLPALEFGLRRWPAGLRAPVWARVGHHVEHGGPVTDVARWSKVLGAADAAGMTPPPVLLDSYLRVVLTSIAEDAIGPGTVWLPRLTSAHERTVLEWADTALTRSPSFAVVAAVADTLAAVGVRLPRTTLQQVVASVVVPRIGDPDTAAEAATELRRMAASTADLPGLVCDELERVMAQPQALVQLAAVIPSSAAEVLAGHAVPASRCALLLDVVGVCEGTGTRGPVSVLAEARRIGGAGTSPAELAALVRLLWPDLPKAADAVAVSRRLGPETLARSGLADWFADRLVVDAEDPGLDRHDFALAHELSEPQVLDAMDRRAGTVCAVTYCALFERQPAHTLSPAEAVRAVDSVAGVPQAIRRQTLSSVAYWIHGAPDAAAHAGLVAAVLESAADPREFVGAYRQELIEVLRTGSPGAAAVVLPALACVGSRNREVQDMLDMTAAMVLTGRSKQDREAITRAIGRADHHLRPMLREYMGRAAPPSWPVWWDEWQQARLRTSMVRRLIARRRTARAVD